MAEIGRQFPLTFGLEEAIEHEKNGGEVTLGSLVSVTPRLYAKVIDELLKNERFMNLLARIDKITLRRAMKKLGYQSKGIKFPKGELTLVPYIVDIKIGRRVEIAIPFPFLNYNPHKTPEEINAILESFLLGDEHFQCKYGELRVSVEVSARYDLAE
jgi:hypothetical protein